jgi:hypothetical protein
MAAPLDRMTAVKLKRLKYSALFPNTHVYGMEQVMENLQAQIAMIKGASIQGLIKAAMMIREDTEKTPYITPLDLGNLRSSWFITTAQGKIKNDKWNTGFRNIAGKGIRNTRKVDASRMATDHVSAITESKGRCVSASLTGKEMLVMGYSANYAVYVHENMNANFKRDGSGAKWFQEAVNRNSGKILKIIGQNIIMK